MVRWLDLYLAHLLGPTHVLRDEEILMSHHDDRLLGASRFASAVVAAVAVQLAAGSLLAQHRSRIHNSAYFISRAELIKRITKLTDSMPKEVQKVCCSILEHMGRTPVAQKDVASILSANLVLEYYPREPAADLQVNNAFGVEGLFHYHEAHETQSNLDEASPQNGNLHITVIRANEEGKLPHFTVQTGRGASMRVDEETLTVRNEDDSRTQRFSYSLGQTPSLLTVRKESTVDNPGFRDVLPKPSQIDARLEDDVDEVQFGLGLAFLNALRNYQGNLLPSAIDGTHAIGAALRRLKDQPVTVSRHPNRPRDTLLLHTPENGSRPGPRIMIVFLNSWRARISVNSDAPQSPDKDHYAVKDSPTVLLEMNDRLEITKVATSHEGTFDGEGRKLSYQSIVLPY